MKNLSAAAVLACATLVLSGCTTMRDDMKVASANTKEIGLLIQSINQSTAVFQKQRDAIAVSSKAHRDSLEAMAMRYEADAYRASAAWNVAGQSERKHTFDALKEESGNLLNRIEAKRTRELAQAEELRKTRSAVLFQGSRLNEAAVGLVELGEPLSNKENVEFYYRYLKEVRNLIKTDSEAAAAAQTSTATTPRINHD